MQQEPSRVHIGSMHKGVNVQCVSPLKSSQRSVVPSIHVLSVFSPLATHSHELALGTLAGHGYRCISGASSGLTGFSGTSLVTSSFDAVRPAAISQTVQTAPPHVA